MTRTTHELADGVALWLKSALAGIGNFQARLLFVVFYYVILAPLAIAVRVFSDPLEIRTRKGGWKTVPPPTGTAEERARRQF